MQDRTGTYFSSLTPKWLGVLILLISIGGYSNYTQPVDFKETIEVLISPEEFSSPQNSILYSDVIDSEKSSDFLYIEHKYLVLLSLNHTKLSRVFKKNQSVFVSLYNKHKIISTSYTSSYNDKEDAFHFSFIG
ncbi:hypothetical protein IWQ47_002420 [Aquimarina sp. EL_43]|uniref:hypothetical protein n=1 Tax=unclassified Aquimarina TaxID=2627091 RepID=UPI0018CB75F6|nr:MULTISPECIES: hypothetical protein [unclassified Aquimarina]MBG6130950.1 hypothetical protein [Aquimarina sp. EL_35]MBG6151409.1 hypothetical protein [Aquimarina sp. EL_32]MBG6169340.1 hypothetical protein [Aquimarina sp. EL_43]